MLVIFIASHADFRAKASFISDAELFMGCMTFRGLLFCPDRNFRKLPSEEKPKAQTSPFTPPWSRLHGAMQHAPGRVYANFKAVLIS